MSTIRVKIALDTENVLEMKAFSNFCLELSSLRKPFDSDETFGNLKESVRKMNPVLMAAEDERNEKVTPEEEAAKEVAKEEALKKAEASARRKEKRDAKKAAEALEKALSNETKKVHAVGKEAAEIKAFTAKIEADNKAAKAEPLDIDDVRLAMSTKIQTKRSEIMVQMGMLGAEKLSDMEEEDFPAFIDFLNAL